MAGVLPLVAAVALAAAPPATFERACAVCHGRSAQGDGPGAPGLDPHPRDLTETDFRFRTTPSGAPPLPSDLERTIRRGLPGSAMPAFDGLLSDTEIADLVAFIGSLRAPDDEAPLPVAIPAIPRATDFRHDPFKGGRAPEDLARAILTGLNGSPMPSYADALLFAREDYPDYGHEAPTREALDALGPDARAALRDARLASLVHYVLSLDKRSGFWSIVFRQRPELEPR